MDSIFHFWIVMFLIFHNALQYALTLWGDEVANDRFCKDRSFSSRSEAQVGSVYDFVLDSAVQVDEVGTKTGHPYYQVSIVLGVKLGIYQCLSVHTVELYMVSAQIHISLNQGEELSGPFCLRKN